MNGLFRTQAIEHRKQGLHGKVLLLPQLSHTLILGALLLWALIVFIWLFTSHYARKETVSGWLEPPEGITRVYAETNGIIQKVLVAEGEEVTQDQPLFIVNDDRVLASGDHLQTNLINEYNAQRQLLNEQLTRTQSIFQLRMTDLQKRIGSAQQDIKLIDEQTRILTERYTLVSAQVERFRRLKQNGHVSNVEFDNAMAQELALKSDQQTLLRNRITQTNAIEQLHTELTLLPDENANSLGQLRSRLSDIAQQIVQMNGQSARIVKAPRAGVVNNLQAREGQQAYANNNIPLLTLFPNNQQLSVQLLIPVRAIGFIESGQLLAIRYDAFPYQKFGIYQGTVTQVSKTLLLPNEVLNTPIAIKEPVYRVTANLTRPDVQAYGKDFALKPGMTLSADVSLSERSLIQWLLEPLFSLKGRI
jgi:membrane fusion protein